MVCEHGPAFADGVSRLRSTRTGRGEWRSKETVESGTNISNPFVSSEDETPGSHSVTLRETAMSAIAATRFIPEKGRNRLSSMVEGRPDWVLSRQRAWGVPITLFVKKGTNQYLNDAGVNARIIAGVREHGVDGLVRRTRSGISGERLRTRRLRTRHRHSRRLVRFGLHACLHAGIGALARPAMARRPLSRRQRPASRLVSSRACCKAVAQEVARHTMQY